MFRRKKSVASVTIAQRALESIFDECDRYDADETGGRLLGTYRGRGSSIDIDVSGVIGPGPNARRTSTSFFQDGDYQERVFRSVEAQHPEVEHLGNWHTHHVNGHPTLSGGDIATYRNIVNHRSHNTDFFYALLVVRKNTKRSPRYDVRHYLLRRNDETVYEIPHDEVRVVDLPLWSTTGPDDGSTQPTHRSVETPHQVLANPERARDRDFFADFYPDLKPLFSEKLQAPYWKGALTLVDGSRLDVVTLESADGGPPEYSIVTSKNYAICAGALAAYKGRKFRSARHAIIQLERDLNREIYRARK
jgi:proteasome lid subunit RPN8/RPN11